MPVESATLPVLSFVDRLGFHRDGYLVVRELFSAVEIAAVAAEADQLERRADLIHTDNLRCRWQNHCETQACQFDCFDPVIDLSPSCARVARDARLFALLAELYGEPACLFKDKLIFKPPGAQGYNLHQDYIAWDDFPRSFTTVIVAIDQATADNGATQVVPAWHRQGYLSPADGMYHDLDPAVLGGAESVTLELEPGDAAIFGGFVPHRSEPNRSDRSRRQLYLSYNAESDGGDRRDAHYRKFHDWLRERYAEYGKTAVYFA